MEKQASPSLLVEETAYPDSRRETLHDYVSVVREIFLLRISATDQGTCLLFESFSVEASVASPRICNLTFGVSSHAEAGISGDRGMESQGFAI